MSRVFRNDHDLSLPDWGPYSKKNFGVSHLSNRDAGLRFDVCVVPGRFRGEFFPPDTIRPCGWSPWDASSGLSAYSYRQQIVWKDQVYAQVEILPRSGGAQLRVQLVNHTTLPECLCLHLCAYLTAPEVAGSHAPLRPTRVTLPASAVWIDALQYSALNLPPHTPYSGLNYDARLSGETCGHGFTGGFGLGAGFGRELEHSVSYSIASGATEVLLRCRGTGDAPSQICVQSEDDTQWIDIPPKVFTTHVLTLPAAQTRLTIRCQNRQPLEIDGLAFGPQGFSQNVAFTEVPPPLHPTLERTEQSVAIDYGGYSYDLSWQESGGWIRGFVCDDLGHGLLRGLHDHVSDRIDLGGAGHVTAVCFGPLDVPAGSSRELVFQVHERAEGRAAMPAHPHVDVVPIASPVPVVAQPDSVPKATRFGHDRLRAVLLTNVVFPIRAKGHWIRHFTPGRWWNSLYTWDSGCIGLGLATIDLPRAIDNLLAYLCNPGDTQAAFVHHGSMVPTQFYLAQELWNKTQDKALLQHLWPRLEQYYHYFTGHHSGSTMRPFASGLLAPWDYFYNSGGWDDYPPQQALRADPQRRARVAPCITSAGAIRIAKIMAAFATILGHSSATFLADAETLTHALQTHAWNEANGFFGYVEHNAHGTPCGQLTDAHGNFFNRGMDGLSPLLADAVDGEQATRMWSILLSPERFATPLGLSAVDMQAPYFSSGGYWNGSVWMPYQWFFWKAMLDYGHAQEAWQLANTVLNAYGNETSERYFCWEHFMIASKRGAGWHHFGGLSAPLLNLFESYYTPGTITGGHDFILLSQQWNSTQRSVQLQARYGGTFARKRTLLITLLADTAYQVRVNGQEVTYMQRHPGTIELTRSWGNDLFTIEVKPS